MRRVCSCNPVWVKYYHEDMGWGPFVDRPCVCGCPWRHGKYRPEWPPGVIDHVDPEYEPRVRPMDALRAEGYPDMILRLSTTRIRSASSSAPPDSARTSRALSSPPLPRAPLLLSSGCRPRPRVSPATIRSPRGFVTGSRLLPARLPIPALRLRGIDGTAMMGPRILGRRGLLAGSTRLSPRWCTGRAPARVRDMPTGALLLARRPILGLLTPLRPVGGAGRALTVVMLRLALKGPGTASWMRGSHRWLTRWVSRGALAVGGYLPFVPWASRRLVEAKWPPRVGLPPLRLARWTSPGVGAGAPRTACRGRDRVSALAVATGVSSLVRLPTLGPSRPLLIIRVPRRPARS